MSVLYEFKCPGCNAVCQEFFPMGEAPETVTCDCGSPAKKQPARGSFLGVPGGHDSEYRH